MVACIVRELGIPKTIDSLVAWDPKQCKHSPGTHVLAMIANILMGRTALYGVEEFYENLDVPVLFGLDASASDWSDSTLARTLDKIFEAGPKRVFSTAAMQAVVHYGLVVSGDGIPIIGEAMDGNTQDKVWNRRVLEELVEKLCDSLGDLVYVADSAVVTKDNLDIAAHKGSKFISRLPAVFNQEKEVKDKAWAERG